MFHTVPKIIILNPSSAKLSHFTLKREGPKCTFALNKWIKVIRLKPEPMTSEIWIKEKETVSYLICEKAVNTHISKSKKCFKENVNAIRLIWNSHPKCNLVSV